MPSAVRFVAREQDGTEHAVTAHGDIIELDGVAHTSDSAGGLMLHHGAEYQVTLDDVAYNFSLSSPYAHKAGRVADAAAHPLSPMPGRVVAVHVKTGDKVEAGQALMVLEGMKMEYTVKAAVAGTIEKVLFEPGAMVDADAPLAHIKPE
jgi:biotin carboxyl carrier protein